MGLNESTCGRLRMLRAGKKLSQIKVEKRARLPKGKYWRIENGYDDPSSEELSRLARVLGVDASALSSEEPQARPA